MKDVVLYVLVEVLLFEILCYNRFRVVWPNAN